MTKSLPLFRCGERFGRLTVVVPEVRHKSKRGRFALVTCSCGSPMKAVGCSELHTGNTLSCGCLKAELHQTRREQGKTHSHSLEYNTWESMKDRCLNPRSDAFHNYGGRGITICDRWRNSFADFIEDMAADRIQPPRSKESTTTEITSQATVDGPVDGLSPTTRGPIELSVLTARR